jgi:hypothetical protein
VKAGRPSPAGAQAFAGATAKERKTNDYFSSLKATNIDQVRWAVVGLFTVSQAIEFKHKRI